MHAGSAHNVRFLEVTEVSSLPSSSDVGRYMELWPHPDHPKGPVRIDGWTAWPERRGVVGQVALKAFVRPVYVHPAPIPADDCGGAPFVRWVLHEREHPSLQTATVQPLRAIKLRKGVHSATRWLLTNATRTIMAARRRLRASITTREVTSNPV